MTSSSSLSVQDTVFRAGTAYSEGKFQEAFEIYSQGLQSHPDNALLLSNMSAILLKLKKFEEAVEMGEKAVKMEPNGAKAYYRLGEALKAQRLLPKALKSYCAAMFYDQNDERKCKIGTVDLACIVFDNFPLCELKKLELDSDRFALLATIGQLFLRENKFDEARDILTWSSQLASPSLKMLESVLGSLGHAHYQLSDYQNAINSFEKQLEISKSLASNQTTILENLANSAELLGDYEKAVRARRDKLKFLPQDESNCLEVCRIGELLLLNCKYEESLVELETAMGLLQRLPHREQMTQLRITVGIGCAHAYRGDIDKALGVLLPIETDDESLKSQITLAVNRCYIESGQIDFSIQYLNDQLEFASHQRMMTLFSSICVLLCRSHLHQGSVAVATRIAKRLLRMGRDCGDLATQATSMKLLASAYEQEGDKESALALLNKYRKLIGNDANESTQTCLKMATLCENSEKLDYLKAAVDFKDRIIDVKYRAEANSAILRHYLSSKERVLAEDYIEKQKLILQGDIVPATKSLILEDIAIGDAEESYSNAALKTLESSLTEAQDAGDSWREVCLLDRMGDGLQSKGDTRKAEIFYKRSLAAAKQLRNATQMLNAYEKLAELSFSLSNWTECVEYSRFGITLAKILQQGKNKTSLLFLMAVAEIKREHYEVACMILDRICARCKEEADLIQYHKLYAEINQEVGNCRKATWHLNQHIELFHYDPSSASRLETLLSLARMSVDQKEQNQLLKEVKYMIEGLEPREKMDNLLMCSSICSSNSLVPFALNCLHSAIQSCTNELWAEKGAESMRLIYSIGFPAGIPVVLQAASKFPSCNQLRRILHQWNVLKHVPLYSNEPMDDLEEMENPDKLMTIFNEKGLTEAIQNASTTEDLELLHFLSWNDCVWQAATVSPRISIRRRILDGDLHLLGEELLTIEKIFCASLGSETEMISMWYDELCLELHSSALPPCEIFPFQSVQSFIKYAAVVLAFQNENNEEKIYVLELCKWQLDSWKMSKFSRPSPPNPVRISGTPNTVYSYAVGPVTIIWMFEEREWVCSYHLEGLTDFASECIVRMLRKMHIPRAMELPDCHFLIGDATPGLRYRMMVPWLRDHSTVDRCCSIAVLSLLGGISSTVSAVSQPISLVHSKCASTRILVMDESCGILENFVFSLEAVPDVVISVGAIHFDPVRSFLLNGANVVVFLDTIEEANCFVRRLLHGVSISSALEGLGSFSGHGDPDYRIQADSSLFHLRNLIRDDVTSFIILARAISNKRSGFSNPSMKPIDKVARALLDLNLSEPNKVLPLLQFEDTEEVNRIWRNINSPGKQTTCEILESPSRRHFFTTIYEDHIFDHEGNEMKGPTAPQLIRPPITTPRKQKQKNQGEKEIRKTESSGYASDGDYLVPQRKLGHLPKALRSSAHVISVNIPSERRTSLFSVK